MGELSGRITSIELFCGFPNELIMALNVMQGLNFYSNANSGVAQPDTIKIKMITFCEQRSSIIVSFIQLINQSLTHSFYHSYNLSPRSFDLAHNFNLALNDNIWYSFWQIC